MERDDQESGVDIVDNRFLATSIGLMARDLYRAMSRAIDEDVAKFGLAAHTCRYLAVMRDFETGISPKELSEYLRVTSPTTIAALRTLKTKGLIRAITDKIDRRRTLYFLTPKGRKVEQLVRDSAIEIERVAISDLSEQQAAEFRKMVAVVRDTLRRELSDPLAH